MNLIFRLMRVVMAALFQRRIGLMDSSTLRFQVLPTDLDLNMHMTNARYLSIMDLGRMDLLIRGGMLGGVKQERWLPVVGGIDIKFHRPLRPFQRFTLKSRLVCWDEKWLYMEQRLESDRGVHAVATVRGLFRGREGSVPSRVLLERMGHRRLESPPFPTQVLCLMAWEAAGKRMHSKSAPVITSAM
ncbi:MAG: acyl-CoA thioesterase [Candidatus Thiodiazotropha sp.]